MIITRWSHIMIHHSLTKDGQTVSWQAIRRYHMSWQIDGVSVTREEYERRSVAKRGKVFEPPWRAIGYHYGVELINDHYEILVGREIDQEGAHCVGMNARAIGICLVGNFDLAPPPADQWKAGVRFVRSLCRNLLIPIVSVVAHRDYAQKSCPGKQFDMDLFRKDLASIT